MSFGAVRGGGNLAKDFEFAVIIIGVTLKLTSEPNGTPYCSRATIDVVSLMQEIRLTLNNTDLKHSIGPLSFLACALGQSGSGPMLA